MSGTPVSAGFFNEILAIMDDQTWIWNLVSTQLSTLELEHVRLPSTVPIRQSWDRLKGASRLIIHWESPGRSGGAIVEEILDVQPSFDVGDRIIVLTTNPTHEDVVYFSELGLRRILRLRNRDRDLPDCTRELNHHLADESATDTNEQAWRRLLYALDTLESDAPNESLTKIEERLRLLKPAEYTARYLDAEARVAMLQGRDAAALAGWSKALDKNPNYYRAYHNLIRFHRSRGRPAEALALMQKMHELNRSSVSRLVGMGEVHVQLGDDSKAETCFRSALERDSYCSGALNGLAELRFKQGDLDETRRLLARSQLAYKTAANLNRYGIDMVKKGRYEAALDHYTRAQYVLPQQDKGPLLFYNIGLCYSRWGRLDIARQFLKIALIKEPSYRKAQKLLLMLDSKTGAFEIDADTA